MGTVGPGATALVGACVVALLACQRPAADAAPARVPRGPAAPLGPALADHPQSDAIRDLVDTAALDIARERAALGVVIVVVDVATGGLLALGDYGGASLRTFPPSGTLRPLVLAAAIEEGADPEQIHPGGAGSLTVGNVRFRDGSLFFELTMTEMVQHSAVLGPLLLAEKHLSAGRWGTWMVRFGLLDPLEAGPWRLGHTLEEATGHARDLPPVAVARAYAVLANDGQLTDGRQLVRVETARAIQGMLEAAVTDPAARGHEARVPGQRTGGKTSCGAGLPTPPIDVYSHRRTSVYCSFVGMLPMQEPRLVVLVGVETPYGPQDLIAYSQAAAPYFARIAPQLLELAAQR